MKKMKTLLVIMRTMRMKINLYTKRLGKAYATGGFEMMMIIQKTNKNSPKFTCRPGMKPNNLGLIEDSAIKRPPTIKEFISSFQSLPLY